MRNINFSQFRKEMASLMDSVNEDKAPLLVTRGGKDPVVVMSLEDFNAYEETFYLMKSPKNAERLNRSIEAVKNHQTITENLIED